MSGHAYDDEIIDEHEAVSHNEAVAWCPTHQTVHLGCDADPVPITNAERDVVDVLNAEVAS